MFAYLSKKIAIPGGLPLCCVAWCAESGWIACGGDNALLKVFRLDAPRKQDAPAASGGPDAGAAAGSSKALSQNQTLEGHSGAVVCATWNHIHSKLTTSDDTGLIIVWTLVNDTWYEEMINNRNKGIVKDMRWTGAGDKICIAYDDGAVIVGSVDGNRLWGKDLSLQLSLLQWSPDGSYILFASASGECHTYDSSGNAVARVQLFCNEGYNGHSRVVGIEWYNGSAGHAEPNCPVLAICLDNGRMQLMRHDMDDSAVCVDTGIRPSGIKWNHNGSVLAVMGRQATADGRELWLVQFYSQAGEHLRTMRVPGNGITGLAWEGSGLRLALSVESHIFFTSVRQAPLWGCFAGTVVYAFSKPDRPETCVMFWGTHSNERNTKYVKRVNHICAAGEFCLLVTKGESQGEHILILCNAIGSPVDSKVIELEPKFVSLTDCCAIAASEDAVYVWQFRNNFTRQLASESAAAAQQASAAASGPSAAPASVSSTAAAKLQRDGRERVLHIDSPANAQAPDQFRLSHLNSTADPICAITAHQHLLLVARSSGALHAFSLPTLSLEGQYALHCRPQRLQLNCDCSRVAVVDFAGVLSVLVMTQGANGKLQGEQLSLERKDVWDLCWATDNPELLAVMEKGRLVVLRGSDAEEPVTSSAWLAGFSDLQVHAVLLDDIMQQPQTPELSMVRDNETRSLRDTRMLLAAGREAEAEAFITDNAHPRLWRLLAEHALERLDLATAEKGFVHCRDMQGLQLVRHLAKLGDKDKQQAEVHVYFKRFDEAEALYRQMDRLDLAINLRGRLGDWFKVEKLLRESGGDDVALVTAWNKVGAYYSDRQKWAKAAQFYTQARNTSMLAQCFYQLEDFASLTKLVEVLTEGQPLLADLGRKLQSVGLCSEAVAAFSKYGDMEAAMDCCMQLHQWDQALALAQACNFTEAEALLQQYAQHLLEKKKYLEAVELYRKAQRHSEAAKLLIDAAEQLAGRQAPPLQVKKLYVLAALEVQAFRKQAVPPAAAGSDAAKAARSAGNSVLTGGKQSNGAANTLAGLMTLEGSSSEQLKGLEGNPWRGAEAYHFCLLAHQQLYAGQVEAALRTALQLRKYDDVLDPGLVYAFLALVGFYSSFYGTCSKAFVKLESLPSIPKERREAYADLAISIFQQHAPADPHSLTEGKEQQPERRGKQRHADDSGSADRDQVCVASGRTLRDEPKVRCRTCKHSMIAAELGDRRACPLCHSPLLPKHQQDLSTAGSSISRSSSVSSSASRGAKHVRLAG